jgi:hypothetical protein
VTVPRFFCENCGKEVSARAKICPHCARFFSEVRCPRCGFTGTAERFLGGCPSCGYMNTGGEADAGRFEFYSPDLFRNPKPESAGHATSRGVVIGLTAGLMVLLAALLYFFFKL